MPDNKDASSTLEPLTRSADERDSDTRPDGDQEVLVRLCDISKQFGNTIAVHALDLEIHRGEFFALLGPSGCGKTTLLRLIGGFLQPTTGTIEIDGEEVTSFTPDRRRTNMVFQGYGLFPHMTVRQNVAYGLRIAKMPRSEINDRVAGILDLVHMTNMADRLPHMLSGGQQQRVALARALIMEPAVLLLDEPLAALDLKLRKAMQEELRQLHHSIGGTFVFVTHDQGEAMALANRIAVMNEGRILQQGKPEEIYESPASEFVAGFIGEANMLRGHRASGTVRLASGAIISDPGPDGEVVVVVRPSNVRLAENVANLETVLSGRLVDKVYLGTHVSLKLVLADGHKVVVHRPAETALSQEPDIGSEIGFGWTPGDRRIIEVD